MGLFNVVKIDKKCSRCGAKTEWQSKRLVVDGIYPIHNSLEIFELDKRLSGEAYTLCRKCNHWAEILIVNGEIIDDKHRIRQYEKSFEKFMNKKGRKTIW